MASHALPGRKRRKAEGGRRRSRRGLDLDPLIG